MVHLQYSTYYTTVCYRVVQYGYIVYYVYAIVEYYEEQYDALIGF